ncbi:MAG: flagellar basal body P-ring formation chaperone FlgA [Rubripirellula sp.]
MPILSPFSRQYTRRRDALLSFLVAGFACLVLLAASCRETSAQETIERDAIRRIERDYNVGEANRRLTVVTLRSRKNVALESNLIRLGDVVEPVDPDMPGWSRIARLGIGLVPVDGTEMVIERDRLEPFIHSGHKSPVLIRWIGPQKINVRCQFGREKPQQTAMAGREQHAGSAGNASVSEILRASATSPLDGASTKLATQRSIANVDRQYLLKVKRWIVAAFLSSGDNRLDRYEFQVAEVEKIRPTKRNLDVAILGTGLVQVTDPTSRDRAYVPAGALKVGVNGDLVLASERANMPLCPAVNIPKDAQGIRIKSDGTVEVQAGDIASWTTVGKIEVSTHVPVRGRVSRDEAVTLASATGLGKEMLAAEAGGSWQVLQGFLESPSQEAYREFESIAGVEAVTCLHSLREGLCKFRLQGRGLDGPVDLIVGLHLTAKPVVAAPKKSYPRGHRLALQDLHLIPIEVGEVDEKQFDSLQQLVGMEVSKSMRVNRPILRSDVRQPTLVHRGDLLDLRVVGAGIVITTAAKALEDGPLNGLVEVETLRPRKRKFARVVSSGVVEILSRPPQVGNLLEERRK